MPSASRLLDIVAISPSSQNPRKDFNAAELAQLVDSIKREGVLEPILVRPRKAAGQVLPGQFEIIAGERRWRAARKAGLLEIPAIEHDVDDAQALRLMVVENDQRSGLRALERSNAHQQMKARGLSVEQIATETSTSPATVRDSLKLQELVPAVKKAWAEGKLDYSKALIVAKLPGKLQGEFLKDALEPTSDGEPLSVRQIRDLAVQYYMLDLSKAPFAVADALLLPKAGACSTCPKRTGAQPEMFEGLKADLCIDKTCHASKCDAHLAAAEKGGAKVLSKKEAAEVFKFGNSRPAYNSDFDLASEKPHGSKKTFAQLVDKADLVLAKTEAGAVVQLVRKSDVAKLLPKEAPQTSAEAVKDLARVKQEREHEIRVEASKAARLELLERVTKAGLDTHWLRVAIAGMVSSARSEPLKNLCKWRGLDAESGERGEAINELASTLVAGELRALLFDLALAERITPYFNGGTHTQLLRTACGDLDVDLGQLEKDARAAAAEKEKAKKAPKGKGPSLLTVNCGAAGCDHAEHGSFPAKLKEAMEKHYAAKHAEVPAKPKKRRVQLDIQDPEAA